jgi:type II secretory pathway pseudopilin PulG
MIVWKPRTPSRHGITLMEVLIAIGILSIGLTSVAALLPAGGSQARKAIISDRAANLAENALADAITIGLARPLSLTGTAPRVVFDPAGSLSLAGTLDASLQALGVLAVATGGTGVSKAVAFLFGQGRDDIVFNAPATGDALPTNSFTDGARAFDGRTTCLWAIESLNGSSIAASSLARLSVVIFQDRDFSSPPLTATVSSTGEITVTPPAGRTIRDVLKTGTVIVFTAGIPADQSMFFAIRSASPNAAGTAAYGVFDRTPPAGNCTILLDSVGLAQTIVTLEGPGPFSATMPREVVP